MDGNSDLKIVIPWFVENEGAFASLDDVFREVQRDLGPDFDESCTPIEPTLPMPTSHETTDLVTAQRS